MLPSEKEPVACEDTSYINEAAVSAKSRAPNYLQIGELESYLRRQRTLPMIPVRGDIFAEAYKRLCRSPDQTKTNHFVKSFRGRVVRIEVWHGYHKYTLESRMSRQKDGIG